MYQPQSEETRVAYERLLSVLQTCLAGVDPPPDAVLLHVADDILSVLKDDWMEYSDKKLMLELHLPGRVTASVFYELVSISESITDYPSDDESLSDEENEAGEGPGFVQEDDDIEEEPHGPELNVQEIDDQWLLREIEQAFGGDMEPGQCKKLAEGILEILANGVDDKDLEDQLLEFFEYDKFELIRMLVTYRREVVARCTPPSA